MSLHDLCGSEKRPSAPYSYIKNDGALVLFAIDRPESFERVGEYLVILKALQIPILLVGTKSDLRSPGIMKNYERVVSFDEAEAFAKGHGLEYIETSAKDGTNVTKAFEIIARGITKAKDAKKEEREKNQAKVAKSNKSHKSPESSCSIF